MFTFIETVIATKPPVMKLAEVLERADTGREAACVWDYFFGVVAE